MLRIDSLRSLQIKIIIQKIKMSMYLLDSSHLVVIKSPQSRCTLLIKFKPYLHMNGLVLLSLGDQIKSSIPYIAHLAAEAGKMSLT